MTEASTEKFVSLARVAFRDVIVSRANEAIRSALHQDAATERDSLNGATD